MYSETKLGNKLKEVPTNEIVRLYNIACVYCNTPLNSETSTKEHIIGRRFVPKGKLHGNWNLVVNACRGCNERKSNLEDDISAITMQGDVLGRYGHEDEHAKKEAERKARNSYSRRTKKAVKDSKEQISFNLPFGNANFSFKFTSPPQIDSGRAFELARLQLIAFFYWITYDKESERGYYWPGIFYPLIEAMRGDWGNVIHIAFMRSVYDWEPRVFANNADGFFKLVIRKTPDADCWSWAIEWNHTLRMVGFVGDIDIIKKITSKFPKLDIQTIQETPDQFLKCRTETPIKEEDDILFESPGTEE